MVQGVVHYGIHFLVPFMVVLLFYKKQWLKSYAVVLSTFVIDLDHFLATPFFDSQRCSIDFHLLHSYAAIGVYLCLLVPSRTRLVGMGLGIHIIADLCDCLFM
jgi:hypothetical protein